MKLRLLFLMVLAAVVVGCTGVPEEEEGEESGSDAIVGSSKYVVRLDRSFEFCLAPVLATSSQRELAFEFRNMPLPHLGNVRTLAHVSDVAYWEPVKAGPEMERLGFGRAGDGARLARFAQNPQA